MKLYVGLFTLALAVVLAIVAVRGTYAQAWEAIFGKGKTAVKLSADTSQPTATPVGSAPAPQQQPPPADVSVAQAQGVLV